MMKGWLEEYFFEPMKGRVFIKHESMWFRAHGWSTSLKAALGNTTHH